MLLFSYLWLIIFDRLLLHTCFPLDVGGSGRLHRNRYHQQHDKGIVFVIPVRINYWSKCKITNWYFKRLWTWSLLCYISQELTLATSTVVLKQGKLQHAAVYIIKFRMTLTKTEYLITCHNAKHFQMIWYPCINDLVYSYISYMTI